MSLNIKFTTFFTLFLFANVYSTQAIELKHVNSVKIYAIDVNTLTRSTLTSDKLRILARESGVYSDISNERLVTIFSNTLQNIKCDRKELAIVGLSGFQRQVGDVRLLIDFIHDNDLVSSYYTFGNRVVREQDGEYCFFSRNMPRDISNLIDSAIGSLKP